MKFDMIYSVFFIFTILKCSLSLNIQSFISKFRSTNDLSSRISSNMKDLTQLSLKSNYGIIKTYNNEIISLIDEIKLNSKISDNSKLVDGVWKLLWTTEKEQLFLIEKGLFGKNCLSIEQVVDINNSKIG